MGGPTSSTLGVTAVLLEMKPILLAFDKSWTRETGDMLAEYLMKTLNDLKELSRAFRHEK